MVLGIAVTPEMLLVLGLTLFTLLLFQLLVGLRKIKFGRKTWVYHRWVGYVIIGVAVVHGTLGIAFVYGLRLL